MIFNLLSTSVLESFKMKENIVQLDCEYISYSGPYFIKSSSSFSNLAPDHFYPTRTIMWTTIC